MTVRPAERSWREMFSPTLMRAIVTALTLAVAACDDPSDGRTLDDLTPAVAGVDGTSLAAMSADEVDVLELGRDLYPVCSVCHGDDAGGTQLGPPLLGPDWINITGNLAEIEQIIRSGVPAPDEYPIPMPVLGGGSFDDQEIRALAAYIHAIGQGGS